MFRSIKRTSAVRRLAVVALTVDIMRMQLRRAQTELGVLKAVSGNDMQGRYSGLSEICYEHTTKPEESRELIKLCQSGRLYAIRDWISAGKSLRTAPETKKTVLSVAIKTGFHSLVELIAPHETLEAKNQGLADAVRQKRLDLVELLVA